MYQKIISWMNEPVNLDEIIELTGSLINPTPDTMYHVNQRKRQILAQPNQNFSELLQMSITDGLNDSARMFVIDLIYNYIKNYYYALPIPDLITFFLEFPHELLTSDAMISKLSNIAAFSIRIAYQYNEGFMIDFKTDIELISDYDIAIYTDLIHYMEDTARNRQISISFRDNYLLQLFQIGLQLEIAGYEKAPKFLSSIIGFGIDPSDHSTITMQSIFAMRFIDSVITNELFDQLLKNINEGTFRLLSIMCPVFQQKSKDISMEIQSIIITLSQNYDLIIESNLHSSFSEFLLTFDPSFTLEASNELHSSLLSYMVACYNSSINNFISGTPGAFAVLERLHNNRNEDVIKQIVDFIVSIIINLKEFINSLEEDTPYLWMYVWGVIADQSEPVFAALKEKTEQFIQAEISSESDCALAFLFEIASGCFSAQQNIVIDDPLRENINYMIEVINKTDERVESLTSINDGDSVSETKLLDFMNTFVNEFFSSGVSRNIEGISISLAELAELIMKRYIRDISRDICVSTASTCLREFISSSDVMKYVAETELPEYYLDTYKELPLKNIVFQTLAQLMFLDKNRTHNFLLFLNDEFHGGHDDNTTFCLLKLLSGMFNGSFLVGNWQELYEFAEPFFRTIFIDISKSAAKGYLLHFLYVLVKNFPKSNPFSPQKPSMFRFPNDTIILITNILESTLESVAPIIITDSVFRMPISPASLGSADVYLNHQLNSNEDDEWLKLSKALDTVNMLTNGPCCNFGIMKYYECNVMEQFTEIVCQYLNATPVISFLIYPNLLSNLIIYINQLSKFFPEYFLAADRIGLILEICKAAFLIPNYAIINYACESLCQLTEAGFDNLTPHFVLALNSICDSGSCPGILQFIATFEEGAPSITEGIMRLISDAPGCESNPYLFLLDLQEELETRYLNFASAFANSPIIIDSIESLSNFFVFVN